MPHAVVQGRKLYYELHGDHPGPPLALAMGIGGSCRGWLPLQVPEYSKHRRTLIFDWPGVGGSEPYAAAFSTADLADTMAALLNELGIERASVLGAFMGGMVAQELALRHPQRVERLVLVGTYARPDAKRRTLLEHWRALARCDAPPLVMVRDRLLWTLHDDTMEQRDLIDAMVEFYTHDRPPVSPEIFVMQCEACLAHDALERLGDIRHEALVMCGRNDQLTPPKFHRQLADSIPGARLVTFGHAGHVVMVEYAEPFNRAVVEFVAPED